jgi:hypothetical protein
VQPGHEKNGWPDMNALSRSSSMRKRRLLAGFCLAVLAGSCSGAFVCAKFTLLAVPWWYGVTTCAYWSGLWSFLVLIVLHVLTRAKGLASVALGLSLTLTLPMYLSFILPWLLDGGSFEWFFAVAPFYGALLGPVASLAGRFCDARRDSFPPLCQNCGYSLRGLTEKRCPECGTPSLVIAAKREEAPERTGVE